MTHVTPALDNFFFLCKTLEFSPKLTKTKGLSRNITEKYCLKVLNLNHKVLFSQVFMTEHTSENISMQNTKSRVFAEREKYFLLASGSITAFKHNAN